MDCKGLNPYRRLGSGLPGGNGKKWQAHYDPYDITVVWLRDHRTNEWVTVPCSQDDKEHVAFEVTNDTMTATGHLVSRLS